MDANHIQRQNRLRKNRKRTAGRTYILATCVGNNIACRRGCDNGDSSNSRRGKKKKDVVQSMIF